jgi:hypothetical protein
MVPAGEVRTQIAKAVEVALEPAELAGWNVHVYEHWMANVTVPAVVVDGPAYRRDDRTKIVTWTVRAILPDSPQPAAGILSDAIYDALAQLIVDPWGLACADVTSATATIADVAHPGWLITLTDDRHRLCQPPL